MKNNTNSIILTIDVEDWFQVENFKNSISYDSWESREVRIEKNTHILLDLFDSIKTGTSTNPQNPKATFFILGWIAERFPHLVQEIVKRGHEIASHGHMHHLCSKLSVNDLVSDLTKSKSLIEDIAGLSVKGYRAPSFDISMDTLSVIESCGFLYDSSYNSFSGHGRYGQVDCLPFEKKGIAIKISDSFYELPVSNLSLVGKVIPWGGGGYFRLTPSLLFHLGVRRIIEKDGVYLFYTHPWEFDPDQPRVQDVPASFKFRHYINLHNTKKKLFGFINEFKNSEFITCEDYLTRRL
ncbi:MAG: XrtA system polysaccharide deacetylase [Desulfobacteraceae bacterium]